METGQLSNWLTHGLRGMRLPVICLDARHAKAALMLQLNKTNANDALGLAQIVRLKARRGPRKAIVAVAASILTAVYWMLRRGVGYVDLGADHFDRTDRTRLAARLARKLGFEVSLT